MLETLQNVAARYDRYLAMSIPTEIAACDDMFVPGQLDHYFLVGRSAIDIVVCAMLAGRCREFRSVLDLPCGGGRVTRHLKAFLPDAKIFVSDLNKEKEAFVVEAFGATPLDAAPAFDRPLPRDFDLIFVGSLLTHLNAEHCERALRWLASALAPNGILIVTTHGRTNAAVMPDFYDRPEWRPVREEFERDGFGFRPLPETAGDAVPYGGSLAAPSWVLRLANTIVGVRVLAFSEAAWASNQDALALWRRP